MKNLIFESNLKRRKLENLENFTKRLNFEIKMEPPFEGIFPIFGNHH